MSNRLPGPMAKEFIKGRAFFANKNHWCSHEYHKGVLFKRYCAIGYLMYHIDTANYLDARDLLDEAAKELGAFGAIYYNDHFGHEGCLQLYDKAIELALNKQL